MVQQIEGFNIIGISVRTTNENNESTQAIGALWGRLYQEGISHKIPNKLSEEIYAVYSDYKKDHTGKYTTTIGFKVNSLDDIPEGLSGVKIEGGDYTPFLAKGTMPLAVVETRQEIWGSDKELNRKYITDFEVYGKKATQGDQSEAPIFIGIKKP